jgi:hypothetical protein
MKGQFPCRPPRVHACLPALLAAILLVLAAAPAWPAAPPAAPDPAALALEMRAVERVPDARASAAAVRELETGAPWRTFAARNPGWVAAWKTGTAVPHRLHGFGRAPARPPGTPADAEAAAAGFLGAEAAAWVDPSDLRPVRSVGDAGGWWVQFAQHHRGVRVVGGKVSVRLNRDGRVVRAGLDIRADVSGPIDPVIGPDRAWREAIAGFDPRSELAPVGSELVVLPVPGGGGRLAYEMRFSSWDPPGSWVAHVDAADGRLLLRENHVRFADVHGTLTGVVETLQSGGSTFIVPFPHVEIALRDTADSMLVAVDTTAVDGSYLLSPPVTGTQTMEIPLAGPFGRVFRGALLSDLFLLDPALTPVATIAVDSDTGGAVSPSLDNGNSLIQDRDAYFWAMRSHDWIQGLDPSFTLLDYEMPIATDLQNSACNAFWNGLGITFFPSGNGCSNTARMPSVVIHEYGHGITDLQYRPFQPSGAMHEGFSDYVAATMLNDPRIGVGFFGPGTVLRSVANSRRTPEDLVGEPHADGLILAGALWDVRTFLGTVLADSLWHYARYGLSDTYDDYFFDYLLVDDDDGNVYNGTPHFNQIAAAFERHGIGDYSIRVAHAPVKDTEDTASAVALTASFLSLNPLVADSVRVHVQIGSGEAQTHVMTATGGVREFTHLLDAQPAGTEVAYWFTAVEEDGRTVTAPPGGETEPHRFRIGVDTTPPVVVHAPLADQPVGQDAIRVRAVVTDNLDAGLDTVTLTHTRNAGPETATPMAGLGGGLYEGLLSFSSLLLGDVFSYRIDAVDRAASPNATQSPRGDPARFTVVRGIGSDFEADAGGLLGEGVWEWGEPSLGIAARSGTRVWATGLDAPYPNVAEDALVVGPLDMTGYARASLSFWHVYDFEDLYDGGTVFASSDGGATWDVLTPVTGYPVASLLVNDLPGFSGSIAEWTRVEFDLSPYRGELDVRIRLQLASDPGLAKLGWYVDDLQVTERQVLAVPLRVWAASGKDGRVPVFWSAPLGVPADTPASPITGYNVYRSGDGGETFARINGEPVAGRSFLDTGLDNGEEVAYRVSALYGEEESPLSPAVVALPYRAGYEADADSVLVEAFDGRSAADTITVANRGTGFLKVGAWAAFSGQTADDVRIRLAIPQGGTAGPGASGAAGEPPGGEYTPLIEDPFDSFGAVHIPDIKTVEAQVDSGSLYLKVTAYGIWGVPDTQFNFAVAIDIDGDVVGEHNPGDVLLLSGAAAQTLASAPAVLVDPETLLPVGFPHYVSQAPNTSAVEWGIFLEDLDFPDEVRLFVTVMDIPAQVILDRTPNRRFIKWLDRPDLFLEIPSGESAPIPVALTANDGLGTFEAALIVETNDPDLPVQEIPIVFTVSELVPVRLTSFAGRSTADGLVLEWTTADAVHHVGFHVFRAEGAEGAEGVGGAETRLTGSLLPARADGVYRFRDTGVSDGGAYLYRLGEVGRDGSVAFHGPFLVRHEAAAGLSAPVLFQNAPNPVRAGTMIRFGLPEPGPVTLTVYSAAGRLVRRVLDARALGAGYHETTWDGTDDAGRRVAAGIYTYRLEAPGRTLHRKLAVLR